MFVSVIITAGGSGKRFASSQKKQFVKLLGKPVLYRTIDNFYINPKINEIVLVLPSGSQDIIADIKNNYKNKIMTFAEGGKERQDSVYNGLNACNPQTDYVMIHDGVRPFLSQEKINQLIEKAIKRRCVILVKKVTDTIKFVENEKIIRTIDRKPLYSALTPQVFDYKIITELHKKAKKEKLLFTDDAAICEHYKQDVFILETEDINIKITKPSDLKLAEEILKLQEIKK